LVPFFRLNHFFMGAAGSARRFCGLGLKAPRARPAAASGSARRPCRLGPKRQRLRKHLFSRDAGLIFLHTRHRPALVWNSLLLLTYCDRLLSILVKLYAYRVLRAVRENYGIDGDKCANCVISRRVGHNATTEKVLYLLYPQIRLLPRLLVCSLGASFLLSFFLINKQNYSLGDVRRRMSEQELTG